MKIRIPQIASLALVTTLMLGLAAPALAAQDAVGDRAVVDGTTTDAPTDRAVDGAVDRVTDRLEDVRARCQAAIERRVVDLGAAQSRVAGVEAVTAEHLGAINSIIDRTEAGLADQSTAIAAASTAEELRQLCTEIATSFRVYLVVLPQTHLTVGADRIDVAIDRGHELVVRFDEAVEAAAAAGANVTEAVALRDSAVAHLEASGDANATVASTSLGVTAASYNDGSGETILDAARSHLRTAHDELEDGIADARAAVEALRRALGELD